MLMKTVLSLFAKRFINYEEKEKFLKQYYPLGTYFTCSATNGYISLKKRCPGLHCSLEFFQIGKKFISR